MLYWSGEDGIGETCKCAGEVVLRIAEGGGFVGVEIPLFECATGVVEGAELDGDAGADAD
jgi:hypothetical protein